MIRGEQGDRNRTGTTQYRVYTDATCAYENIAEAASDPRLILLKMHKDQFGQGLPKNACYDKVYEDAETESLAAFEMHYGGPDRREKSASRIIQAVTNQ